MPISAIVTSIERSIDPVVSRRGGSRITSSTAGSTPSASARALSVSRLIHRICVASSGTARPVAPCLAQSEEPGREHADEHRRAPRRCSTRAGSAGTCGCRRRSRGPRGRRARIVAKLSSARIMSAASFETSVPLMPIATPMSACLSAGASFTPSPVIATISSCAWSASTMRSFCSGATRAKTEPVSTAMLK